MSKIASFLDKHFRTAQSLPDTAQSTAVPPKYLDSILTHPSATLSRHQPHFPSDAKFADDSHNSHIHFTSQWKDRSIDVQWQVRTDGTHFDIHDGRGLGDELTLQIAEALTMHPDRVVGDGSRGYQTVRHLSTLGVSGGSRS